MPRQPTKALQGGPLEAIDGQHLAETVRPARRADEAPAAVRIRDRRRLKLCFIAETMMTGVGRHVVDVIEAMAAHGDEIHLLHSVARTDPQLLAEIDAVPGVQRRAFPMRLEPHWSDIGLVFALARHLRTHGPFDLVHGHSSKGGAYARLLSLFVPGRYLYTPHAFITMAPQLSRLRHNAYALVERCLALRTETVICVSEQERQHALGLGIRPERLAVVYLGLPPFDRAKACDARAPLGLPADAVVIGFVGRMDEQKAPLLLVEAAARLMPQREHLHVVMIGDGPLKGSLQDLTRQLRIANRFSWRGNTPSREWVAGFDVVAIPSAYEGFSYVLLEAQQAGVPVVGTPVGGIPEVVEDGVNGYVVPHDDVEALAARLALLVDDPALRRSMGERALDRSARFSLERMIAGLEEIYLGVPAAAVAALKLK